MNSIGHRMQSNNMQVIQVILIVPYLVVIGKRVMEPFVVGGKEAKITDFPYVAYIGIEEDVYSWICGSSILNQGIILTAGHCLFSCTEHSLIVIATGHEDVLNGSISTAHSFIIHDKYVEQTTQNDIALVRLNSPLGFDSKISRVALMKQPPYYEEAYVAGWGFVNEVQKISASVLQYTNQYVWPHKDCLGLMGTLPNGTICASSKADGYASVGDSGSALVVRGYIQIGIVSFKKPETSRSVVVYTDTGYFYSWITKSAEKLACV